MTVDTRPLQVLLVGTDPSLLREVEDAAGGASRAPLTIWSAPPATAVRVAANRRPSLVLVELMDDLGALKSLSAELAAVTPGAFLAGLYHVSVGDKPDADQRFVGATRAGLRDFVRRPVSSVELAELLERCTAAGTGATPDGLIIAFHSTKGGVGKSTLAVNTACALALRHPDRVLLVDASIQLGVCASALDLAPRTTLLDAVRERDRLDGRLLQELAARHHSGLHLLAAPGEALDAVQVDEEALSRVLNVARRTFDFVVLDTFPMLDALVLTALELADHVFLVNQGTVPDVVGAAGLLRTLDGLGLGRTRRTVVVNRTHPAYPARLALSDLEERLGEPVAHEVPYDRAVLTGLNLGEPRILRGLPPWPWRRGFTRALRAITREIEELAASGALRGEEG